VIIVTGSVEVRPDDLDQAVEIALEHVRRSRTEPGCVLHSVHHDVENPNRLVFLEHWADRAALDAHFAVPGSGDFVRRVSALATAPPTIEIHETVVADGASSDTTETTMAGMGQMTMRPIDSLELPAGETVTLEPGGYHIMLIDLVAPLETGQEIEVTLTFESAGERTITVPVQDDAP
jgi:copper(I)-binding protein